MKVMVFQWPWGTLAISLSPRGDHPRKRLHIGFRPGFIDEDETIGINLALIGLSTGGCRRALRRSGRCSLAMTVFF